jgi:hypothetical protein
LEIVEVPAKIFLMGEYLVLEGGDAVLEALRPGYRFEIGPLVHETLPHPDSPAGKLLREAGMDVARFRLLEDSSLPGFGGSTAELLLAWHQVYGVWPEPEPIHRWYRERVPAASGADLLLQARTLTSPQRDRAPEVYSRIYILERIQPSKRPTHEDLALERPPIDREALAAKVTRFRTQLLDPVESGFRVFSEFADELYRTGRETEDAHRIRRLIESLEGIEGVKGCGAGLHDQFLMALKPGWNPSALRQELEQIGLRNSGSLLERVW